MWWWRKEQLILLLFSHLYCSWIICTDVIFALHYPDRSHQRSECLLSTFLRGLRRWDMGRRNGIKLQIRVNMMMQQVFQRAMLMVSVLCWTPEHNDAGPWRESSPAHDEVTCSGKAHICLPPSQGIACNIMLLIANILVSLSGNYRHYSRCLRRAFHQTPVVHVLNVTYFFLITNSSLCANTELRV